MTRLHDFLMLLLPGRGLTPADFGKQFKSVERLLSDDPQRPWPTTLNAIQARLGINPMTATLVMRGEWQLAADLNPDDKAVLDAIRVLTTPVKRAAPRTSNRRRA